MYNIMQSFSEQMSLPMGFYSTDQMQLKPRVHASFKSLANEMRVVHSLDVHEVAR